MKDTNKQRTPRLTPAQQSALNALRAHGPLSAQASNPTVRTWRALEARGLATVTTLPMTASRVLWVECKAVAS